MMQNSLEREFILNTNDVDFKKRISPLGILNIFQEVASEHAELLGCGYSYMSEHNMFWVLSRIKFIVNRYPVYKQKIIVKTWPIKNSGVYFERDYEISDTSGEVLICATSVWCVLSADTHAIVPAKNLDIFHIDFLERRSMDEKTDKIKIAGELQKKYTRQVMPGDLDFNMHVNNTKYADYVVDGFEAAQLNSDILKMQINYVKEGKLGSNVDITYTMGDKLYVIGEVDGSPLFQSYVQFKTCE